ncbi:related to GPI-anchor biosynthesis protein PIG-F [Ramularia collo-cygni]|uniref:Related to GPI-anchor biosynthesis protein PIG-F n=1 Tax=Ramularia collo-cygni TaxID=112498 RepID=A0A2D3VCP8_9PEZI|nr:related to GPI-anchor biosynthesis protein PIG-F [Ramularia collo-cygni]CZT22782.1 related to GPI-anchor biosynthesis protein PIG-F [Ramularia collo-cygni]
MAADETIIKPVAILPDQISLLVRNLQPILLISLLPVFFNRLVQDPASTLLALAPTVALIQALYCICCLPSTGQSVSSSTTTKPGQKKKTTGKHTQDLAARLVPAFLSFLLTLTLSTPLFYILSLLFGAPLLTHTHQTSLLALHLALLTTPQLFYVHGLDSTTWLRLASLQQPLDEIYGQALGALLGGWLGAIPIPLDWDREWQRWPVTVILGVYIGAVGGKVLGGYLCKGVRMRIT